MGFLWFFVWKMIGFKTLSSSSKKGGIMFRSSIPPEKVQVSSITVEPPKGTRRCSNWSLVRKHLNWKLDTKLLSQMFVKKLMLWIYQFERNIGMVNNFKKTSEYIHMVFVDRGWMKKHGHICQQTVPVPSQFNMEPENHGFQKESPFPGVKCSGSMLILVQSEITFKEHVSS